MIKNNIHMASMASLLLIGCTSVGSAHAGKIVELTLDENNGTQSFDSSGNNNHAVLHGATWAEGENGSALAFDGVNAYAQLSNDKTAALYNLHKHDHTIAAWVKPNAALGHRSGIITRWGVHQGLFYNADQTFTFKHRTASGTQTVTSIQAYEPGEFYHIATTINGSDGELILYINGEQVAIKRYSSNDHSTFKFYRPWRIGVKNVDATSPSKRENFSGVIDEVLFLDEVLSPQEIKEQWGEDSVPTAMCSFGEESGTVGGQTPAVHEPGDAKSGQFISFEQAAIPSQWSTDIGILAINNQRAKHGDSSLQWQWTDGAVLEVADLQGQGLIPDAIDRTNYTNSSFRMWLYNDKAVEDDPLRVEFYDQAGNLQYHYFVNLNFTGWRAATVKYRTDMAGDKSSQALTDMKIHAPASTCSGQLLIDFVDFTAHKGLVTGADYQVPTAATGNTNHWTSMLHFEGYAQPEPVTPTAQQLADATTMQATYRANELLKGANSANIAQAIAKYEQIGIQFVDGKLLAQQSLFGPYHNEFGLKIGEIDSIILTLASDYVENNNLASHDRFINLVRYMLDQGFAAGSLLENSSHIGYSTRKITQAILYMDNELKAQGLWSQAYDMLAWYNTVEQIWQPVNENVSNSDHARTRIPAILGVILHIEDEAKRAHYLAGYKAHIETWLTSYNRGNNGVKPDYSSFHHNTQYPGYVYGALGSIATAVNYLSHSAYSINENKFDLIKKMALSYAVQHAGRDMPLSMAGRNPFKIPNVSASLIQLGNASETEQQQQDFYAAYNRLYKANDTTRSVTEEANPSGFWQFNYRPVGVYRQQDWVANIKGLSKQFWGSEIYTKDNRFGRYQSYGSIFINYQPAPLLRNENNFNGVTEAGWDWNKIPGTTTKHLSWNDLLAKKSRQDEWAKGSFSGALRFGAKSNYYVDQSVEGECGVYGLDFQQVGTLSSTHEDGFGFKKSVFACNGMLIALGSNINSGDGQNIIATNLFQKSTVGAKQRLVENAATRPQTSYDKRLISGDNWLIDPYGTGYFVKSGDNIAVRIGEQSSPYHRENLVSFKQGHFASAWIDHGAAPIDASYQYVILPNATKSQMATFAARMNEQPAKKNGISSNTVNVAPYQVLQQNSDAHVVSFAGQQKEAYVLFKPNALIAGSFVLASDTPLLVMAQQVDNQLNLSLSNPDHNFAGKAPRWGNNQAMPVTLTLKGRWQLDNSVNEVASISLEGDSTVITISTINAQAYDLSLSAVN